MTPTGCGSMRRKEPSSNTCPMPRAEFIRSRPLHDALVSNCSAARDSAHHGLTLDHSAATVPDAALALALCGETGPALAEMQRLAAEVPNNTLVNEIYLPEVKAAVALLQHHPEQVAGILSPAAPYLLVSKVPHLAGRASLEMKNAQQAITDFEPGIRYRAISLGEGANGTSQVPDYASLFAGNGAGPDPDRPGGGRPDLRTAAAALEECRRRFHPRAGSPPRAGGTGRSRQVAPALSTALRRSKPVRHQPG